MLLYIINFCECSLLQEICFLSFLGVNFHIDLYISFDSYFPPIFATFNLFGSERNMLKSSIPIPIVDVSIFHFLSLSYSSTFSESIFLGAYVHAFPFSSIYFCSLSFMPWSLFCLILTLLFRLSFDLHSTLLILMS